MDCETCSIVDVCKIADSVRQASVHAVLTVTNCKIKARLQGNTVPASSIPNYTTQSTAVTSTATPGFREYRNFSAESKAADELAKGIHDNVAKVTIKDDKEALPDIQVECPTCCGQTTESDLSVCEKCGENVICSNCATEAGGKRICEKCWNE